MEPYQPISRDFYDEIEFLAAQKIICDIAFTASNGAISRIRDKIEKLYTKGEAEYMTLQNGLEIPLKEIININGKSPQNFC